MLKYSNFILYSTILDHIQITSCSIPAVVTGNCVMATSTQEPTLENLRVSGDGAPSDDEEDLVNPWDVHGKADTGVDYDKLISKLHLN